MACARRVLPLDAQGERLDAAAHEEGGVRIAHAAEDPAQIADHRHQAARPAHDAGEDVVVPREVLGRAVHDEVDPEAPPDGS